jgi:hypothetical protein
VQGKHVESNPYPRSNHDMQLHKIWYLVWLTIWNHAML